MGVPRESVWQGSVFIGSSSEKGLAIARQIKKGLENRPQNKLSVTIWDKGVFRPNMGYLEDLIQALNDYAFAILVATADDVVRTKGRRVYQPRDNVIFELGLFMGKIGRTRTFFVCTDEPLKLPSDLDGVTT